MGGGQALQVRGYNGAHYMSEFTDHMPLWDVTTPDGFGRLQGSASCLM